MKARRPGSSPTPARARPAAARAPAPYAAPAWLLPAAIVLGLVVPAAMLARALAAGDPLSFPVDDAWIHLQYARNLAEHGAFSYFPGDRTTAGSTAPLFTLLEALLWFASRNEVLVGLGLGLAAHAAFLVAFARWALRRTGSAGWAAFAVTMVALDGRFGLLAVSGMETSLFLLGLSLAFLAWSRDDARGAGAALGATVWVRPEALVLAGVFALDALIARRAPRRPATGLAALAALVAAYVGFNWLTGHTAFPNTLAAKAAYYAGKPFTAFLSDDVAATVAGGWMAMLPLALLVAAFELRPPRDGAGAAPRASVRAELGWALALVLAYAVVLPYSHRFNRYLVPALPALAIAGAVGMRELAGWAAGPARGGAARPWARSLAPLLVVVPLAVQAFTFAPFLGEYAAFSRYHLDRHVRAGRWLAQHTPANAVIATHDVGAIAFHARRPIVDMAGLVTPEVVPHLLKPDYAAFLARLFEARGVTHLAVLESWQPVDNQEPLFTADPNPEVLRVFAWQPGRTHLMDPAVRADAGLAAEALASGTLPLAEGRIARALAADSGSAMVWTLAGAIADRGGRVPEAAAAFARAVRLFPRSADARAGLGITLARLGRLPEARAQLDTLSTLEYRPESRALLERMIERAAAPER